MRLIIFLTLLMGNILAYGNQVVVGVLKFAPPFSLENVDKKNYSGFCIDLMQEVCSRLHESCQYQGTTPDKQFNDLRQGLFDVTFSPSPASTENNDFVYSMPYIPGMGQFMILKGTNIQSINDLKNKKIGVLQITSLKKDILSRYTTLSHVHEFTTGTNLLNGLTTHQVDAILLNASLAKYLVNNNLYDLQIVGQPVDIGMGYGMIALKKNAELINKINKTLLEMEADGSYLTIYNKYFGH